MEEIYRLTRNKRIIVRKKIANFLEKVFRYCGYDFDHDVFKKVIYSEDAYKTPVEAKIKNYYDAYTYLLNNAKNTISKSLWKRFYYIVKEEELDSFLSIKLSTKYFHLAHLSPIEQAIEYHMYVYQQLQCLDEEERMILALIVFNFILVKNQIPCVQFLKNDFLKYEEAKIEFLKGNKASMLEFCIDLLKNNAYMKKSYYKNLKPVSLSDILHFVEERKEELKQKYQVKGLWIHGSIAKGMERIDSDLDFFVQMPLDLLDTEKKELLQELKQLFFDEFKRMIDVQEIVEYLDDDIIKELRTTKKLL